MAANIGSHSRTKDILVKGAVRAWHVIFILALAFVVAFIAAYKLTRPLEMPLRGELFSILIGSFNAAICLAYIVVVPEFRRSLPTLFARPLETPRAWDLVLAFLCMLTWAYGLYRVAFLLPLMEFKPEWYSLMGFAETGSPMSLQILAIMVGSVILAPIGEELMFRGYLMNLWSARWGVGVGIVASSIVFGLFHFERALFATGMGLVFALVYYKYDSLWPGILLHMANNILAPSPLLGHLVDVKSRAAIQDLANWIPEMLVAVLFFPVAWLFWQRFRPAT